MIDDMAGECSTSSGTAIPDKHTPAPWVVSGEYIRAAVYRNDAKDFFPAICSVKSWPAHHGGMLGVEETRANRQLMAAAPNLLAACELADQILARDGLQEIRGLAWHDGERWVIQEAIRRAKGEK